MAATVRDLWTKQNPDKTSRTTRVHSARWGIGKRWQVVWTEAGVPVSETFTTRDAAEEFAANVVVKQTEGTWITKDKKAVTLSDMWDLWIPTKSDKAKSTTDNYRSTWKRIDGQFGERPCHTLTRAEISTWIASLTTTKGMKPGEDPRPLGDAAKRLTGIVMKALLDLATEERVILHNPMKSKDLPTQKPSERRYLTVEEVDRLFAAADELDEAAAAREREDGDQEPDADGAIDEDEPADPRIRTAVELLVRTGVRPGEAFGFRVGDLSPARGRLRVQRDVDDLGVVDTTKTHRHRDVPVGGEFLLDLESFVEDRDREAWLLPATADGHVWTASRWRTAWEHLCAASGISGVTTYELRHTAASLAIHSGANPYTVARMLGHSDVATTLNYYGHLWDQELDTLPARMDAHMAAERARFAARREREAEKKRGRRRDGDAGGPSAVRAG